MIKLVSFKNPPSLTHLKRLTTPWGLIQHTELETPDPAHGYSLDDNARAIVVTTKYAKIYHAPAVLNLTQIYLDYLKRAQLKDGRFHNFLSFVNKFTDRVGSEDCFGRAIWALGFLISQKGLRQDLKRKAKKILSKSYPQILSLKHPRAIAHTILGLFYLEDKRMVKKLAELIYLKFAKNSSKDWIWFENKLTHSNALLPLALFLAYDLTKEEKYLKLAEGCFDFLNHICQEKGKPAPIGNQGWYERGGKKALYDQQPLEASLMTQAALTAFKVTKKEKYQREAKHWFSWFLGNNLKNKKLIDPRTGGCFDGLTKSGVNKNKGAESILSYLLAYLSIADLLWSENEEI